MQMTKRRKYLVNKEFQFRYMGSMVIPLVLLGAALYYLIYYAVFTQMLIPEAVSVTLLPAMKKVNLILITTAPLLLFPILRMNLIHSNRIIGPIHRLERELDRAIEGNHSVRLSTRSKDELSSFVNKVNLLLEKVDSSK